MILRLDTQQLHFTIPADAHSLAGFRRWAKSDEFPDSARISLIRGELVIDMSPERIEAHNQVKAEIAATLYFLVKQLDLGKFYPDGAWITNNEAALSTEPDATFASWQALETGRVQLIVHGEGEEDGVELRGSPDWVLEVVSPTSVLKDAELLLVDYYSAGVVEYWLVDARGESIEFTLYTRGPEGFVATTPEEGWATSRVFGREVRLDRERDRLGGWRYTLHVREK
jgi:Uma2 family endonuclease